MNDGRTFSWPNWRTVRKIGSGGFGTVYEIEKDTAGFVEKAALKVVSIPESDSDIEDYRLSGYDDESISKRYLEALQDVVNEYRVMKELKGCPSIVICDDVQTAQHEDGIGWDVLIKMELLTPLLKKLGKEVSDLQVIQIGKDLCAALMECEKRGVLHRDIKPQNIFVSDNGTYKLGDFGIAKAVEKTTRGTQTGTYKYMAPEVYHNEPYGPRADIYSLGLVLYWLLNERHEPFVPINNRPPTSSEEETARMRRLSKVMAKESLPEPKHGDELLKQVVCKACAYDPNERYQSAAEFRDALEEAESRTAGVWPSPHPVPPTPPKPPIWKWVALGAVGIALLSIIGWGLFSNHSTEETSNPANETQTEEIVDIRITNSELSLRLGEPIQITTETSADNDDLDILYQVSDETIANVTPSGVLTGLRPGTVVIEASYGEQSDSMELSFAIPDSITAEEMNETEREYLCKMIDEKASEVDASENLYEQYQEGYIDTDIGEIHFYQDKELKKNLYSMTYQAHDEEKAEKNGLLNWYGEFYLGHTVMEIFFDSSRSEVYFIHLTDKYYDRDYACYYYNGELLEIKDKSANRVYKSSEDSFVIDGWDWWSDSEIESEYGSFKFTGWADFEEDIYQFALKCCTRAQEEYSYISTYLDPNYIN